MGIVGRDHAARRAQEASAKRKVGRMRGVSPKVNQGKAIPKAPAPYVCGRACGYLPDGQGCPSTVRGGVCPCRCC